MLDRIEEVQKHSDGAGFYKCSLRYNTFMTKYHITSCSKVLQREVFFISCTINVCGILYYPQECR